MKDNKIRSDIEFINDKMENIKFKTQKSIDYSDKNHKITSTKEGNSLYTKMNDIVNKYYDTQRELMEKLDHETKFIRYVGETYDELDKSLKDKKG